MKKVFLGGTVNNSKWREDFIKNLKIEYFNPIVDHWDEVAYKQELFERENCDFCLYIITPKMTGFYSIAEVIDDSNKRPDKTIFCLMPTDGGETFSGFQIKSLQAVGKMVERNGGKWFKKVEEIVDYLNSFAKK
jgi:hypothetical protein